jgi:hypothetical protein
MIIGISGYSYDENGDSCSMGSGKDTVAAIILSQFDYAHVCFADGIKRIIKEVYDFDNETLWGPSELRSKEDKRYLRCAKGALGTMDAKPTPADDIYLTSRYAAQKLGDEWARGCCKDTWLLYTMRIINKLLTEQHLSYTKEEGITYVMSYAQSYKGAVISDVRYKNELNHIRGVGGKVIRVKRPVDKVPYVNHASETELSDTQDGEFDYIINNDGTIEDLKVQVLQMMGSLLKA